MSEQFTTKRINNVKVKKVKLDSDDDTRPVRGADLFPEVYANVFLCARKKSGKTCTIAKIIKECAGKRTKIIAFVSTIDKDATWKAIRKSCKDKGIDFEAHTSLKEDGIDLLDELVEKLASEAKQIAEEESLDERVKKLERKLCPLLMDGDEEEEEQVERKEKYRSPEYIIILDDLSTELKSKSLVGLLKKNRHFKAKIIVSSQYLNDLLPESRKQLDYFLVWGGESKKKMEEIHSNADVRLEFEEFIDVYKFATEKPFSFLYIDRHDCHFRTNFNDLIQLK
jgi:hypothetical protein